MRIIGGKYKGRKVKGFDLEGTRPTMDRIKESMIAMIQSKIKNSICLDLFSGSGSIGLEFLSNGAKNCYFVDNNIKAIDVLNENIKTLSLIDEHYILHKDYNEALKYFKDNNINFDIIFLDPPYKNNFINGILNKILEYKLLNPGGIVMCEYETEEVDNKELTLMKERKYGSKYIKIYKN